ncbi:MAG: amidase [Rhodospirillaceae bacterium]|nr:MAG: amidase [Rhodospirillaceae bacterium]
MTGAIHNLSLLDISARIRRGEVTSEAVTRALLDRIARHDNRLNSILMLLADTALKDARQADAEIASGFWRGPLHGVPIGIKDIFWTEGLPTTAGMEIMKDFRPNADATVVKRLKRAGAVLIAKLHMTEGATHAHHPTLPRPVNPWSAAHWTGVSSSGSGVAVAAGFCYGALGTDTGGSIRLPSAANNLTGIKPTWGRVSRHGLMPLSESLDHIGPMARTAADAAAILQVIAGADPDDPTALSEPVPDYLAMIGGGVSDLVIGIDWTFATGDMPEPIVKAVHHAVQVFAGLGACIHPIAFPTADGEVAALMPILMAEAAAAHAEHFPEKADRYGPELRGLLTRAASFDALSVARAYQARDRFTGRLQAVFRDVDLILTPGLGRILPTWDDVEAAGDDMSVLGHVARFTPPFNLAGLPTISLPGGFTDSGLPVGLQLAGWKLSEPALIRAGAAFQRVTDFHTRHPSLTA